MVLTSATPLTITTTNNPAPSLCKKRGRCPSNAIVCMSGWYAIYLPRFRLRTMTWLTVKEQSVAESERKVGGRGQAGQLDVYRQINSEERGSVWNIMCT